ncbi:MAG: type 4a pilus biogenesis protein PilO [Isosphaerales bacterium]
MKPTDNPLKKGWTLNRVLDRLHDPLSLRAVLTLVVLVTWYVGFEMPLSTTIETTTRQIAQERKRLEWAREIEALRDQVGKFQDRLPQKTDSNEWIQYMLSGVRAFPLKLVLLDAEMPKELGPYKVMVLRLGLEGNYHDLNEFLRWLEANPRLLRIDSIRIEPQRGGSGVLGARLIVLGVTG